MEWGFCKKTTFMEMVYGVGQIELLEPPRIWAARREAFGSATGNCSQEFTGKLNQAEGTMQEMYGQAKDAASDVDIASRAGTTSADDFVRHYVEHRPYTVAPGCSRSRISAWACGAKRLSLT